MGFRSDTEEKALKDVDILKQILKKFIKSRSEPDCHMQFLLHPNARVREIMKEIMEEKDDD